MKKATPKKKNAPDKKPAATKKPATKKKSSSTKRPAVAKRAPRSTNKKTPQKNGWFEKAFIGLGAALVGALATWAIIGGKVDLSLPDPPNVTRQVVEPDKRSYDTLDKESSSKKKVATPLPEKKKSPAIAPVPIPSTPHAPPSQKPKIAIIIDDLGMDRKVADQLLALNEPIAFAVLPHLGHSRSIAIKAHQKGMVVMLHLPMEPKDPNRPLGPGGLLLSDDAVNATLTIEEDIAAVPHVVGVNNHMGSRYTEDQEKMRMVMEELGRRSLFFVDSRTSPQSAGYEQALDTGVPSVKRDVFLDNDREVAKIEKQIAKLAAKAQKRGWAVGIGHPYPETVEALRRSLPRLKEQGIEVAPVMEMLKQKK